VSRQLLRKPKPIPILTKETARTGASQRTCHTKDGVVSWIKRGEERGTNNSELADYDRRGIGNRVHRRRLRRRPQAAARQSGSKDDVAIVAREAKEALDSIGQ